MLSSVAVLAEISLRSPRKYLTFIINKYIYRSEVSKKTRRHPSWDVETPMERTSCLSHSLADPIGREECGRFVLSIQLWTRLPVPPAKPERWYAKQPVE